MANPNAHIASLYSELLRVGDSGEFDKALKVVNKILQEDKDDQKAQHCKAVCLIHLSEFSEALKVLDKHVSDSHFERAYCFYRLNRILEAYDVLKSISNLGWKEKELFAQVLYRLERYDECFDVYKELIKNSEDDFEEERETNLAAVVSNLYADKGKDFKAPQLREHTYELCYNSACILVNRGDYKAAVEKLKLAEELCKKTLEENDATEEEIEAELAVIKVQHGYVLQLLRKKDMAMKVYNQVLKSKPSDVAIAAVASNNIVTLNKDQNIFDSKKKIKTATAESLDQKLNSKQRQMIAINNCLLLLHTNQIDQCRRSIQMLIKKFPLCAAEAALLSAGLHCKDKKVQKAVDVLKEFGASHPDQSEVLSFTLAQLLLTQGHVSQACETLQSMGDTSYTPGVVSALVTLYQSLEDKDSATAALQSAIKWYKKNFPKSPALSIFIHETAKMELRNGHPQEAAKLLEELRKENSNDLKTLAQLISAYSQFNPVKAKEVSKHLPPVSELTLKVDVDNLESTSWTMGAKYIKKGGKSDTPSTKQESSGDGLIQKKKKRHKKGKLPKNYDPSVDPDPERWLPRRERSTYKKKKEKRGAAIGKGTQGSVAGSEELSKSNLATNVPSPSSSVTPTSPNVLGQGPRQAKGGQKKKKKNRW